MYDRSSQTFALFPGPARVWRGAGILAEQTGELARLGAAGANEVERLLVIGGNRSLDMVRARLEPAWGSCRTELVWTTYGVDCTEAELTRLRARATQVKAQGIVGVGGGKAIDTAKLIGHQLQLPVATIPTSAGTCAAWTALSNVYTTSGAFQYDVSLNRAPELLILDYDLLLDAPEVTLRAGIGDALAKWYEASVSSGNSEDAIAISAVQQARIVRDLLLQQSAAAIREPGGTAWQQVVDASVCLAGAIGGLGGAKCRTVAAHAVHNGLTHIPGHRAHLHGEKVAFGILVQLRLEEILQGSQLAATARKQLLTFYDEIGLPTSLAEFHLDSDCLDSTHLDRHHADPDRAAEIATHLATVARVACQSDSDIHHLPFPVSPEALVVAAKTTRVPVASAVNRPISLTY
ncbi:MAG: iron-containing alcohol dehydrogenase [Cyanobacteria bacterium P01_F01_bin.33]